MNVLKLSYEESLVYSKLQRGKAQAVPKRIIREDTDFSERKIRKIIHDLSTVHGIPVGHSSSAIDGGYFIIETPEELAETLADLGGRALELMERQAAVSKAYWGAKNREKEAA